ncbi:uncharacterized protein J4E92_009818 [Alternaria infectoria]|uniref:uncharacterized protein n=1 Tax=Alternaria infectoria TaxID=45303 RepID=UPI0022209F13|nr:uncharacterized protein J4E92_009818 [Alternaria infectoria]KAI4913195.1 hypothetical protein J4E92_009818 [Alternaria infectoria]
MPSSIAEYVPAAILFSPEDVQHFTKWQEEHCVGSLPGIVRNATEYCEFLAHRRTNEESIKLKRGKVRSRNRNPATMCGHGLHPSDIITGGLAVKRKLSSFDAARAKVAKARVKKHVTFTPDTIISPTRSNACFNRNPAQRQSYQPGRHAAPLGLEWVDTSRMSSSIADLLNLKVYATCVQAEFDALVDDSSLRPPSRYQGILSLHPGIGAISAFANQFLQGAETAREEMLEMISVADALIVLIGEDDVVLDLHLSVSDDVEDEDGYGDEEVDQTRWTCWSKCGNEAKPDVGGAAGLAAKFAVDDEKARKMSEDR